MGGVLLFVQIALTVDGVEIFVEKYGENNYRQGKVSLLVSMVDTSLLRKWEETMVDKQLSFPAYFPKNCPPEGAIEEELCVYRYCMGATVIEDDFLSYYQIDPEKYKDTILAYGLSVLLNEQDCIKGLKLPGIKRKFKSFASGVTFINTGKIKRTPNRSSPSHCTWFLYEGIKPDTYFTICT